MIGRNHNIVITNLKAFLSRHKAPGWWRDAKLGIFIHWGLYSVPGFAPTRYMFRRVHKMILWPPPSDWLKILPTSFWTPSSERAAVDNATWFKYHPYAEWYINTQRIHGSPTWEFHRKHFGKLSYVDAFVPRFNKEIYEKSLAPRKLVNDKYA